MALESTLKDVQQDIHKHATSSQLPEANISDAKLPVEPGAKVPDADVSCGPELPDTKLPKSPESNVPVEDVVFMRDPWLNAVRVAPLPQLPVQEIAEPAPCRQGRDRLATLDDLRELVRAFACSSPLAHQ